MRRIDALHLDYPFAGSRMLQGLLNAESYVAGGNETAAHVPENGRMTMLFLAFLGNPLALRLYGKADLMRPRGQVWEVLRPLFPDMLRVRQIFRLNVESVATSRGWSVPIITGMRERDELLRWVGDQNPEEI